MCERVCEFLLTLRTSCSHLSLSNFVTTTTTTLLSDESRTLTSSYYRNSDIVLAIFDSTDEDSFSDVQSWIDDAQQYIDYAPVVLVANKIDLTERRVISEAKVKEFRRKNDDSVVDYFETSAKTGENIDKLFAAVARHAIKSLLQDEGTIKICGSNNNNNSKEETKDSVSKSNGEQKTKQTGDSNRSERRQTTENQEKCCLVS